MSVSLDLPHNSSRESHVPGGIDAWLAERSWAGTRRAQPCIPEIRAWSLLPNRSLHLDCSTTPSFDLVAGHGQGSQLAISGYSAALLIVLHGRLCIGGDAAPSLLASRSIQVTEFDNNLRVSAFGNALWIALVGGQNVWSKTMDILGTIPGTQSGLIPTEYLGNRDLLRRALAMARAACGEPQEFAAVELLAQIYNLQSGFDRIIARCPGRTYARRRQSFLRLQRARNYVSANCTHDLNVGAIAQLAGYSTWHFIRAFRSAYQQTPHTYLIDERMRRARHLLRCGNLAISDVARASGFEDRSTFARHFRQHFGTSASAMRKLDSPHRETCNTATTDAQPEKVPHNTAFCKTPDCPCRSLATQC